VTKEFEPYTPNDAYGENHNIGAAFTLPADMVTLTPKGPESPEFSYRQVDGDEWLSLMIEDAHVGKFEIVLTLTEADYVSANLYAMLRELPSIRQRWTAQQENGGDR
jgi:hypothetical protein